VLDVESPTAKTLPVAFALGPAVPNPSEGDVRFHMALPKAATVTLAVYDVSGRNVGEPVAHRFEAGEHTLSWSAPQARAGIYFARLSTDGVVRARRSIVITR